MRIKHFSENEFAILKNEIQKRDLKIKIASDSMEPMIKTGEELSVQRVDVANLRPFDVIVFWNQKVLICHYVWKINQHLTFQGERWLTTRSAEGRNPDLPVLESHVLGLVREKSLPVSYKLKILILKAFNRIH